MKAHEIKVGDHVFYMSVGICVVKDKTCVSDREYFVLETLDNRNDTTMYIPLDIEDQLAKLVPIASKEEVAKVIKKAKKLSINWNENRRERQEKFLSILRDNNLVDILVMIKCLNERNNALKNEKKRLSTCDNDILVKAKTIMEQLVAYTHNIDELTAREVLKDYFVN